ncbi:DUF4241 domain-containing protein [Actinoplanes sp. TFC3]|uniref:DUF4241 domain-containing protein n=1 Tax=Actinoplanes sp. TFC3 TaxID=1710355 RepID=UPI00082F865C|nr:DUF4241 domain-containing protein [Actinoplanes sp. TFC3]
MAVDIGELLGLLLTEHAHQSDDRYHYRLTMVPAGEVTLPTGRVVACDPLVHTGSAPPFTVAVSPGRYRLRAWVAIATAGGLEIERRTAALQLVVRDEPAAAWEPARMSDAGPPAVLDEDGFAAYPADSGTGTLADERALAGLARWPYERLESTYLADQSAAAPAVVDAVTDDDTGANVVAVQTGWHDGGYATFVGRTAGGAVASFVTDFRVL